MSSSSLSPNNTVPNPSQSPRRTASRIGDVFSEAGYIEYAVRENGDKLDDKNEEKEIHQR